jgi:hypothetical protein
MVLQLIFWPVFVLLIASAQGLIMPAIRRTPPGQEAAHQGLALHELLGVAYFMPLLLAPSWMGACYAIAVRLALFDPPLNYFAGTSLFYVGQTAGFDKLLRKLSPAHPERLSALLRVVALAAALLVGVLLFLHY